MMIVDQVEDASQKKQSGFEETLLLIGEPPLEITNSIYQDFWRVHQAWAILCQQYSKNGEWTQRERNFFPQMAAEEFIVQTAIKLEHNYQNVKALLEDDQIKYCYVDALVSILARLLIRYACPAISEQEAPHLTDQQKKDRKKSFKPLIEQNQVRALLRLCDLLSSCKQQISNHSLRDISKKDFINIGFYYEDLLMIDNAYGTCFNLDTRGFDYKLEQKIAPLVQCPYELSNQASLYSQIEGDCLINCDLRFSVEQRPGKPPLKFVIPGETVRSSKQKAKDFVSSLVDQKGFAKHMDKLAIHQQKTEQGKAVTAKILLQKLKLELQMKVIWVRFVTDRERLKSAMRAYFQAAYLMETHGEGGAFQGRSKSHLFPKSFSDSTLFVQEYKETLKKYGEERPINRVIQIFMRRLYLPNSNVLQEVLKPFNVAQLRKENPRFIYDEQAAIDSIFIYQITQQLTSISLDINRVDGNQFVRKLVQKKDGPINEATLLNTSLQEDLINLITNFFQNISSPMNRQQRTIMQWDEIELKQQKLRQHMVSAVSSIFFDPFVIENQENGEKHFYMKLNPKIMISLMFVFKQKWIYEEAVAANENPNFKAFEQLLMDWITIYNRTEHVFYVKDQRDGAVEVVQMSEKEKAHIISSLLDQLVKSSSELRTGIARQFSQQIQQSQLYKQFDLEVLNNPNTKEVNAYLNKFINIIAEMISQEPPLVNRLLKIEKPVAIVQQIQAQEVQEEIKSSFDVDEHQDVVMQQNVQVKIEPEEEVPFTEEGLIPRILTRYLASLPQHKDTASIVIKLLSKISVTREGQQLIEAKAPALVTKILSFNIDNRLEFPESELKIEREYVVGVSQTSVQLKINADYLSELVSKVPALKSTLQQLVKNCFKLSKEQVQQTNVLHFTEMMKTECNKDSFGYKMREKVAQIKVRSSDLYFSLHRKAQLLNALSAQQMHHDYPPRQNPQNDVMSGIISSPQEVNEFLDLLELLVIKNTKLVSSKFDALFKTVFHEQEFSIEKLRLLFQRIKKACQRLKNFIGKPLNQVVCIDNILEDNQDQQGNVSEFVFGINVNRRLEFECHISIIDYYAQALTTMGHKQANKIGTYEKWDEIIETLMWIPTIYLKKKNDLIVGALKGNLSLAFLGQDPVVLNLQESIKQKFETKLELFESLQEFKKHLGKASQLFSSYLQDQYCVSLLKLQEQKLLNIIWLTANQTNRNPERQNSVNEVIRCNLKSIGKVAAQMAQILPTSYSQFTDTHKLLSESVYHAVLLDLILNTIKKKLVKGTFLCSFVTHDGLIALCRSYNALKHLFIDLRAQLQSKDLATDDQTNLKCALMFTLQSLMKNNEILTPFYKLVKENQSWMNPSQFMKEDTDPKKYQNMDHFFANSYYQMLNILTGFPDPNQLKIVLNEQKNLPDVCSSSVYGLLQELITGFSTIPQLGAQPPNRQGMQYEIGGIDLFQALGEHPDDRIEQMLLNAVNGGALQQRLNQRQGPREPTQDEIDTITAMGYQREEADAALRMSNFDITRSIDVLLNNYESIYQYIERRDQEKEEEKNRKEQEEFEAAMLLSMGEEPVLPFNLNIKTVSKEEFDLESKKYMTESLSVIVNSARQPDAPLTHGQTLTFVAYLIKQQPADKKQEIRTLMFDNLQQSTQALMHASQPDEEAKNDVQMNGASVSDNQKTLELDLQLTLHVLRLKKIRFNLNKDGAKFNYLARQIVTYTSKMLTQHQTLYSNLEIKTNLELFKQSSQNEKDLISQEFCLSHILLNAQQLCLEIVRHSKLKVMQSKDEKDISKWMLIVQPDQLFELISLLLEQDGYKLDKENLETCLLLAIELFSHSKWPKGFNENDSLQKKALQTLMFALQRDNVDPILLQNLQAIVLFDQGICTKMSGQLIMKSLLAVAFHHHIADNGKNRSAVKWSGLVQNEKTQFELAKFIQQTTLFYTNNPQGIYQEEALKKPLLQICDVVKAAKELIRLKQTILNDQIELERKSQPEFEKLINNSKGNDKQLQVVIKQAQDIVFDQNGTIMHKCMEQVFECLLQKLEQISNKTKLQDFTNWNESVLFRDNFVQNQANAIAVMETCAKFCRVYSFLQPQNSQFIAKFLLSIQVLLWAVELKKPIFTPKFRITSARIQCVSDFLSNFLNTLTGFNKIMTHEEKLVKFDLRTKFMQQAVFNFAQACNYFQAPEKSEEFANSQSASLKALTMLLVINALIGTQFEQRLKFDDECYNSSLICLLCKSKSKIVKLIALLVKQSAQDKQKPFSPTKTVQTEIVYKVDGEFKIEIENDQEMSFYSISDSIQEADLKDDNDQQLEEQLIEEEKIQGYLVAQSITCLTAICSFIEDEKQMAHLARKEKKKQIESEKLKNAEENKMEVDQVVIQNVNQDQVQIIQSNSDEQEQFGSSSSSQSHSEDGQSSEDQPQLNAMGEDFIEEEYDAEDDEDEDENDLYEEEEEEDEEDSDELIQFNNRHPVRPREQEAAHDIINVPIQRNDDQMGMPIWDIGMQHVGMRHGGQEPVAQINENWTQEERQVQRTLALLRGHRLNTAAVPRGMPGMNVPRLQGGLHPQPIARLFEEQMHRAIFEGRGVVQRQNELPREDQRSTAFKALYSVFAPMDSKQFFEKLRKTRNAFNERRKQFKDNQIEEQIMKVLKEMRETAISPESRSRASLLDSIFDSEQRLAMQGFNRAGLAALGDEGESFLQRHERIMLERRHLMNMAEAIPQLADELDVFRQDAAADDLGAGQFEEEHQRLNVAMNANFATDLQQAITNEAIAQNSLIIEEVQQPARRRSGEIQRLPSINLQPQMLPAGLEFPDLSSIGQSESLIQIVNASAEQIANVGQNAIVDQEPQNVEPQPIQDAALNFQLEFQQQFEQVQQQIELEMQQLQVSEEAKVEEQKYGLSSTFEMAEQIQLGQAEQDPVNQEPIQIEQEIVVQQPVQELEEQKQPQVEAVQIVQEPEPMTFGIPNSVLIAHDYDPEILHELPEDVRAEILSSINWRPRAQHQPGEENKQNEEENQAQPDNQFGIDPDFLASLPPDLRQELLDNVNLRDRNLGPQSNQPQRQAEEMDVASIIATAPNPQLRAEMLAGLDAATIATLPEGLRAEAQAAQSAIQQRRIHERIRIEAMMQQAEAQARHAIRGRNAARGRPNMDPRGQDPMMQPDIMHMARNMQVPDRNSEIKLEKALEIYCDLDSIFEEKVSIEQTILQIEQQIASEELIVEGIVQLLIKQASATAKDVKALENVQQLGTNPQNEDANACKLIQFIERLTAIKSSKGELKLTNKLVNALTLLVKLEIKQDLRLRISLLEPANEIEKHPDGLISIQDTKMIEANEIMIDTSTNTAPTKYSSESMTIILTLIGVIRLVAKNKNFVSHMLKSLLFREDYFAKKGTSMLQKQSNFLKLSNQEIQPSIAEILSCLEYLKHNQKLVQAQLANNNPLKQEEKEQQIQELNSIKQQLKTLNKNLQLVVLDTFNEDQSFTDALKDKDEQKWKISKQTVICLSQILDFQMMEAKSNYLLSSLGNVLFHLSQKSEENWQLIKEQCQSRGLEALRAINQNLQLLETDLILKRSASNNTTPTKASIEEEKEFGLRLEKQESVMSDQNRSDSLVDKFHKQLDPNKEKQLRRTLIEQQEQLTTLQHIFQLFNLIYRDTKIRMLEDEKQEKKAGKETQNLINAKVLEQIKDFYHSKEIYEHMRLINLTMQCISSAKGEMVELISGNCGVIFSAYMPDLQQMIEESDKNKSKIMVGEKDTITIKPLDYQQEKNKVLTLFKNIDKVEERLKEFGTFCLQNKKTINKYLQLKQRSQLDFSITDIINYMPNLLNFENKRAYFKREIEKMKREAEADHDSISISVKRNDIFMTAYNHLNYRRGEIKKRIRVQYEGEEGADAGGVMRDFYIELSRQMFNPNYSLYTLTDNGVSHYFNTQSYINPDHLSFIKFTGRMVGKALFDGQYMDCYFAKPLYKMILGEDLTFIDLEDLDNELFKSLAWAIENDCNELEQYFSVDKDFFGRREEVDLCSNGRNIKVTNENKLKWIELRVHFYLYGRVKDQIDAFLSGFHELIPKELIRIFDYKELELLISGLPNFDLVDMKQNTELQGYTNNSPQIIWFWELMEGMDASEIGLFLQFVTGCSKIPLEGFKALQGMQGIQKFQIKRVRLQGNDLMRLPQGHTCFNQIDLPEYQSKEILFERILYAIKETKEIAQV